MAKIKTAIVLGATCAGCDVAILDLNEKILEVADLCEFVFWPTAMDFKIDDLLARKQLVPFEPNQIYSVRKDNYTVTELNINSTPTRSIRVLVTEPIGSKGPFPAVVCIGGHGSNLYSVGFSPDGARLVTASRTGPSSIA